MASKNPSPLALEAPCLAIITGATGITGRHCVDHILRHCPEWTALTLSRRSLDAAEMVKGHEDDKDRLVQVAGVDLLREGQQLENKLKEAVKEGSLPDSVRIFHCAYIESGESPFKDCEMNLKMMKNVIEAVEALGWPLQHCFTMEGTKWYGQVYKSPLKTPFDESDPHLPGPNFYYDLQDYLEHRTSSGAQWTWSALRPGPVVGFSTGSYMSILPSIAVYATLCKASGLTTLPFPGTKTTFQEVCEVCDASLLADAMVFTSVNADCANAAFNINNGDLFRWESLWPRIAGWFGMKGGSPLQLPLTTTMPGFKNQWEILQKEHGLKQIEFDKLATWNFMEFVLSNMPERGWFSNTLLLRKAGYQGMTLETGESFIANFEKLKKLKVIPDPKVLGNTAKVPTPMVEE